MTITQWTKLSGQNPSGQNPSFLSPKWTKPQSRIRLINKFRCKGHSPVIILYLDNIYTIFMHWSSWHISSNECQRTQPWSSCSCQTTTVIESFQMGSGTSCNNNASNQIGERPQRRAHRAHKTFEQRPVDLCSDRQSSSKSTRSGVLVWCWSIHSFQMIVHNNVYINRALFMKLGFRPLLG